MEPGTLRALKILVVVMGVAIVGGTATLGILIIKHLRGSDPAPTAVTTLPIPASPTALLHQLDEPGGSTITAIALSPDRLAIQLRGGGPDRVVLLDARSGTPIARIALSP
ncbi:MAG: hypothetical protein EXR09_06495 [Acetobacteraceae bacterium]|nr:hypothetical protein [Acetobacteraceae bacterium]